MPPMSGFPLEFCNGGGAQKNQNDVPIRAPKGVTICAFVRFRIDTVSALVGQTDGQTDRNAITILRSAYIAC